MLKKILNLVKNNSINIKRNDFNVLGTRDEFVISFYNDQVEFITKQGIIIGLRDKRKSNEIFYYEKKEN